MNFMERHKIVHCFDSDTISDYSDYSAGNITGTAIHMDHYRECTYIINTGSGGTGYGQVTINSCSDSSGTTAADVAFKYRKIQDPDTHGAWTDATSTGFATSAESDCIYEIVVYADGLSSTNEYQTLTLTETNGTAVNGAIVAILTDPRYIDSDPDTAGSDVG